MFVLKIYSVTKSINDYVEVYSLYSYAIISMSLADSTVNETGHVKYCVRHYKLTIVTEETIDG